MNPGATFVAAVLSPRAQSARDGRPAMGARSVMGARFVTDVRSGTDGKVTCHGTAAVESA